jgi:translation initiation factor 1
VTSRAPARTVYSTVAGRTCPKCGWPAAQCRCSARLEQKVPERIVVRLRLEKKGRGGKTVTVVDGLPRNREFLAALAAELKRACGGGGTFGETEVELQGDHRDRLRTLLAAKGWTLRG